MIIQDFSDNYSRETALRKSFSIAKYTGYLITAIAERYNVILVSGIAPDQLYNSHIHGASSVWEALNIARHIKGEKMSAYFMPFAANTLPRLL